MVGALQLILNDGPGALTFLCGAGISRQAPSSLPTVNHFLAEMLECCESPGRLRDAILQQAGLVHTPRFESLIGAIGLNEEASLPIGRVFDSATYNQIHAALAVMLRKRASIVTTNFDTCIERAAAGTEFHRTVFNGSDIPSVSSPPPGLYKPHGSHSLDRNATASNLVISIQELNRTSQGFARFPGWRQTLTELFSDRTIVVLGYSGSDDFDITPVLLGARRSRLIWIRYSTKHVSLVETEAAPPNVQQFADRHELRCYEGSVADLTSGLAAWFGEHLTAGPDAEDRFTVRDFVSEHLRTPELKQEMLNQIALHYGQYEYVATQSGPESPVAEMQRAKALFRTGRHPAAIEIAEKLTQELAEPVRKIQAWYIAAASLATVGRLSDAVVAAESELAIAKDVGPEEEMKALNHLGGICMQKGDDDRAAQAFENALAFQKQVPAIEAEAVSLWGLGAVAGKKGDFARYEKCFRRARKLYISLGDDSNVAWCNYNLGDACFSQGRTDAARDYFQQALLQFRNLKMPSGILYATWLLGKMEYADGRWQSAAEWFADAIEIVHSEPGFLWLPDLALLFNAAHIRAGRSECLTDFRNTPVGNRLQELDSLEEGILATLIENSSPEAIARAEAYVFPDQQND